MAGIAPYPLPWNPDDFARRIMGPGYLVRVPAKGIQGAGALVRTRRVILVADDKSDGEVRAVVAHELGELVLRVQAVRLSPEDRERIAWEVADALLNGLPIAGVGPPTPRKRPRRTNLTK
jgi:hypothetical protein